jgi:hypothetical protein
MSNEVKGNTRTFTIDQQKLEDWINESEEAGNFLNAMGVISDEELAADVHKLEDFRVKVEADPNYATRVAAEADQTGEVNVNA